MKGNSMSDYLASVWMITYNHEKFIAQALESVLMQIASFEFEIVIGEDCSTDGTRSIIKRYEAKYPNKIHPIYHETNVGGFRNAYEFTLPRCKGKYIACLEGDDYWIDQNRLQKQVDFLERNPEYGLVFSNQYHFELNGKFNQYRPPSLISFEDILHKNSIPTATACFRKNLLDQFILETSEVHKKWVLQDYPLWLWIYQNAKIQYLDEFFAVYRKHEGSATDFNRYIKGESFYLSVIDIKTFFYHYYKGKSSLRDFINVEYESLFSLSIRYHKVFKCIKYFPYNPLKNTIFISKVVISKILNRNDIC